MVERPKKCFVVSEFGIDEKTRTERTQMLKHLVKKVLEPMGYEVQRADEIDDIGQITHQVIERLLDDDLVIADLTGRNPNVYYELAVRHAARKPVITLMTAGETIPFDVKDVRTVFYDIHDPDKLEEAQRDLEKKVNAIESNPVDVRNPITVARNVTLLQQSADPEAQVAGDVLALLTDLSDQMRLLTRAVYRTQRTESPSVLAELMDANDAKHRSMVERVRTARLLERVREALPLDAEMTTKDVAYGLHSTEKEAEALLSALEKAGRITRTEHGWKPVA